MRDLAAFLASVEHLGSDNLVEAVRAEVLRTGGGWWLEDLDDEEILRMQLKNQNGDFRGRPPMWVPRSFALEMRAEFTRDVHIAMRADPCQQGHAPQHHESVDLVVVPILGELGETRAVHDSGALKHFPSGGGEADADGAAVVFVAGAGDVTSGFHGADVA